MKISLVVQAPGIFPSAPLAVLSGTFAHRLRKAASLGVDGLELAVVDPESLDALAIKEQMASCRLAVSAVSSAGLRMATGSSLLHRDAEISRNAIGRLNELIRFAAQVQAPLVTIGSFKGMRGWVEGNGWEIPPRHTQGCCVNGDEAGRKARHRTAQPNKSSPARYSSKLTWVSGRQ